jgi:hypothetical protein
VCESKNVVKEDTFWFNGGGLLSSYWCQDCEALFSENEGDISVFSIL